MRRIGLVILGLLALVYLWNASWLAAAPPDPQIRIIAHRGVHQNFDLTGVKNDTCTALLIREPINPLMENTVASMRAAFAAGADIVELDVHPTTDGDFAVFHDWTLDCRTEGTDTTRSHDMTYLRSLDVGYGYSADGGQSYPLRGTGIGLMPSLGDVMAEFEDGRFLINFKSREAVEGDSLAEKTAANPQWRPRIWSAYGGDEPTLRASELIPGLNGFGSGQARSCLINYIGYGWTGVVPEACRNTKVMVPGNLAFLLWGWPNRFAARMRDAGSEIILLGPYQPGDPGTSGIDTLAELQLIPPDFSGYIWTNEIELIGPALNPPAKS